MLANSQKETAWTPTSHSHLAPLHPPCLPMRGSCESESPDASSVPLPFLPDVCPAMRSSALEAFQPMDQQTAHSAYYEDEVTDFQPSYHVGGLTTGLRLVSPGSQGELFDVAYHDDDMTLKVGSDPFPQARYAYSVPNRPRFLSDQSTCADSEDLEMPRDMVSCSVPKSHKVWSAPRLPTTLKIRNIPQMYSQKELALEWPNNGSYDFFHLPMNYDTSKGNKTFAVINFTSHQAAAAFKEGWDKQRLRQFQACQTLNIAFADVQGRDANMWQLQKGQP